MRKVLSTLIPCALALVLSALSLNPAQAAVTAQPVTVAPVTATAMPDHPPFGWNWFMGSINGRITYGPLCPAVITTSARNCQAIPWQATVQVWDRTGHIHFSWYDTTSNTAGYYSTQLFPGHYTLKAVYYCPPHTLCQRPVIFYPNPVEIDLHRGQTITTNFLFDSGIR